MNNLLIAIMLVAPSALGLKAIVANNPSWTSSLENEETVFTSVKENNNDEFGEGTQYIVCENESKNAFEVKIRTNEAANNLNVGIHAISSSTNCFFDYREDVDGLRFRLNSANNWIAYNQTLPVALGEWFTLKMVCSDGYVACYANGDLMYSITNSAIIFDNSYTYSVSCWNSSVSFKDPQTYNEDINQEILVPSDWQKSQEDGEDVYTLTTGGPSSFSCASVNNGQFNTFSFDARVNSMTQEYDGNISAYIQTGDNRFLFEYNPAPARSYFRLRYFVPGSAEGEEIACTPISLFPNNQFFNIKIVFADSFLAGYLDDNLVLFSSDTHQQDMLNAIPGISAWCTKPSVKNFVTETSVIDYNAVGYLDLEFNDSKAVSSFEKSNASLSYIDGNMMISFSGDHPTIISPKINASRGGVYSMKIGVRNTFCVRLKNNSSADKIRLNFTVKNEENVYYKDFSITPFSDYKTYYFNISDVYDCGEWYEAENLKKCNHYLERFSFDFNASSGEAYIDAITFEREDKLLPYRAESIKAIGDKKTNEIIFSGELKADYAGKYITILSTEISNYADRIDWPNNKVLASKKAEGTHFEIRVSLNQDNNMTHLSTVFLAVVSDSTSYKDGYLASKQFMIENWNDFSTNPYAFEVPSTTINVLNSRFGAKGDGFSDDTDSFQAAIDYVYSLGGGKIVVPGDTSTMYGRRYIITTLTLKDNVELHLEEGAVLWQSQRDQDYQYDFVKTHDVNIPGVPWTHAAVSWNKPFIYIDHAKNVKLTGRGTLRMADTGTECLDGNRYGWNGDITLNCGRFVHEHPIVNVGSSYVEITDITIKRNAIWTFPNLNSDHIYIGNVQIQETSCINGDGFNFSGVDGAFVDRCTLYSNDDAMILSASYYDPRYNKDIVPNTWGENATSTTQKVGARNIEITHCNVFGGHGLTIIPWASNDPNEEAAEIYNIYVHDNVLGGTSTSVGVWGDNPFHGDSYLGTYDQLEGNDYSPMRDIVIINNIYTDPCVLATWEGGTTYNATSFICDGGIYSSTQFINGDFDKDVYFEGDEDFVSGLANWSKEGDVGTEIVRSDLGYSAYIKGNGNLNEGLFTVFGTYEFKVLTRLIDGKATLKVSDMMTYEVYAEKEVDSSEDFIESKLEFVIDKPTTVRVGVYHQGEETTKIYIDNATLNSKCTEKDFEIEGAEETLINSVKQLSIYSSNSSNTKVVDGSIYTSSNAETKIIAKDIEGYEFSIDVDIRVKPELAQNCGIYLFASNASNEADKIDALNIQLESKENSDKYTLSLYKFSSDNGYDGCLSKSRELPFDGDVVHLKIVVKNNIIFAFTDYSTDFKLMYVMNEEMHGGIGIRSQYQNSEFSNFVIKYKDYADLSTLQSLINSIESMDLSTYTEQSVSALMNKVDYYKTFTKYNTQKEVDMACEDLNSLLGALVKKDPPPTIVDPPIIENNNKRDTTKIILYTLIPAITVGGTIVSCVLLKKKGGKHE